MDDNARIAALLRGGVLVSGALLVLGLAAGSTPVLRAGLLTLMCTPLARVAALAALYARRRDWPFFWISAGVLALLGVGVLLGSKH